MVVRGIGRDRRRSASTVIGVVLALVLAFFAALAKETAVILPAWIGAMEWWVLKPERPRGRALAAGVGAGAVPGECVPRIRKRVYGAGG